MLVVYLQEDKKRRPWRDMMQEKTWDDPVVCRVSRVQTWEYTTAGTKHCFWYYIRVFSWLKKVVLLPSWVFFVNFLFFIVSFVVFYLSLCILVLHLLFLWMKPTTNALSSATLLANSAPDFLWSSCSWLNGYHHLQTQHTQQILSMMDVWLLSPQKPSSSSQTHILQTRLDHNHVPLHRTLFHREITNIRTTKRDERPK